MMRWVGLLLLANAAPAPAAPRLLFAGQAWAAFDHGGRCEAVARSLRDAPKDARQARASVGFDTRTHRRGEVAIRLSRPARAGSSVMLTVGRESFLLRGSGDWAWGRGPAQDMAIIAAARSAGGMRVEARDSAGRRFTDRYLLDGAATAIDAAAAACATRR